MQIIYVLVIAWKVYLHVKIDWPKFVALGALVIF